MSHEDAYVGHKLVMRISIFQRFNVFGNNDIILVRVGLHSQYYIILYATTYISIWDECNYNFQTARFYMIFLLFTCF